MNLKVGDVVVVKDDSDTEIHRGQVKEMETSEDESGTKVLVRVEGNDSFFGIQQVFKI